LIVADTSPLSAFVRVHRSDILSDLFEHIVVPGAVAAELDRGAARVGNWRSSLPFVVPKTVDPSPLLSLLRAELDEGESEAIALAAQEGATLLLIDEVKGRAAAQRLGLRVTGAIGACLLAKKRGLITEAKPLLEDLRRRGGLWLSDTLLRGVLTRIGE
jgi:predicted nucleic acid-binding protein